jgi:CRP-like cAMP-binding protein
MRGKFIRQIPLLVTSVLTDMDRYWLVGKLRPLNFKKGDVIVEQGESGDRMYIVERGTCEVLRNGVWVGNMGREDFFGELAVMYASPRNATIRATTEVTLLSLSRDDLSSTITQDKIDELAIVARARLFTGVPLLSALGAKKKEHVTACLKLEIWPPGVVLARQGHLTSGDNRRMYIVLDGKCRSEVRPSSFGEVKEGVKTISHGHFFNMFAMWYGCPCGATVTTETEVKTLSISYGELDHICTQELASRASPKKSGKHSTLAALAKRTVQFAQTDDKAESETKKSIRYAMWLYLLKHLFLMAGLDAVAHSQHALALVCEQSKEVTFKTWDPVFTKGVPLDMVYILETGALSEHESDIDILRDAHELGERGGCIQHTAPGTCFGIDCLQRKEKNVPTSTLAASHDTLMLSIPGDVLRRMLRNGSLF